jgi:hypothetical protein
MKRQGYMGILIHIPDEDHKRFRKAAKKYGKSLQDFGATIILAYLEARKKKAPILRPKGIPYGAPEPSSPVRTIPPLDWTLPQTGNREERRRAKALNPWGDSSAKPVPDRTA